MSSTRMYQTPSLQTIVFIVTALAVRSVLSNDCSPPSKEASCECTGTSIDCFGSAANVSEFQSALTLANVFMMETVNLKIFDLKFEPDFTFANTSIRNLTLGYNLQNLPSDFFEGSSSLTILNLQNNSIDSIDDQLFFTLLNLKELFLDENQLQELTSGMFAALADLNYLSIANNRLQKIDEQVFQNLSNLQTLILSHNPFSSIENLKLSSNSLTKLEMTNCSMDGVLDKNTFSSVPELEYLDISHNRLTEIQEESMSALKNLKFLDLGSNSIQKLLKRAFSEMSNLTSLDLRENEISVAHITSFNHLYNLKYLDLSGNKLSAILCEYTTDFRSLERIDLRNNRIKTFSQGAFFYSPYLQVLDLTGNPLECSCPLTDSALHLIDNSTIKREDLESVSCVIPVTLASESVIKYESSKCVPEEPCKKLEAESEDEDFNEDEDYNTTVSTISTVTSTVQHTTTTTAGHTTTMKSTEPKTATPTVEHTTTAINPTTTSIMIESSSERTTVFIMNATSVSSTVPQTTENWTTKETNLVTTSTSSETRPSNRCVSISNCSSLSLNVPLSSVESELRVISNFSYDGSNFCLKYSIAGNYENVTRCELKYKFQGGEGTKSNHLTCPSLAKEIITWSCDKNVFHFCIMIYIGKIRKPFCNVTPDKTSTILTTPLLTTNASLGVSDISTPATESSSKRVTIVTEAETRETTVFRIDLATPSTPGSPETTVFRIDSTTTPTPGSSETTAFRVDSTTTPTPGSSETTVFRIDSTTTPTPGSSETTPKLETIPSHFDITALNVYFNNSNLAFATWAVNREAPSQLCNMTLKATTQYFDYEEGVFPCRNNSHRLRYVKETDIFKICLYSQHVISGSLNECTLSVSPALASKGDKVDKDSVSGSMIPLICLLVLLVLIVLFIIFKSLFKKKGETNKYDVRAEEVKYQQRVQVRPQSANEQTMRFSYIARENADHV